VIRGLGVVVVDEDRSETSRAFVEQVAALTAHFAEARPVQVESRQPPLQEGGALRVVHSVHVMNRRCGVADRAHPNCFNIRFYRRAIQLGTSDPLRWFRSRIPELRS
jgi:hypothetical protein